MAEKLSVPRGTADILPEEAKRWQAIEQKARQVFSVYNYQEIRTPIFEESRLFKRSLGQTSDVVKKQLLELESSKEEGYALRPEGTASIVRSYIENSFDRKEGLTKLYYVGPMFRGERPQKGRLRQFHQIGAEIIGPKANHPFLDVETIVLCLELLKSFGVEGSVLKINSLGEPKDKENLSKLLREKLKPKKSSLCDDCKDRLDRNVFRILDCKNEPCKKVVAQLQLDNSYLSKESMGHYKTVLDALASLDIECTQDARLVRGLDYYTHTVFEVTNPQLGSQDAICAGGRYNHLVAQLGGADVPAIGFALGIERVMLSQSKAQPEKRGGPEVFIIPLGNVSLSQVFQYLHILRSKNISSDMSYQSATPKNIGDMIGKAAKTDCVFTIVIGEEEEKIGKVRLKNMKTREDQLVEFNQATDIIKNVLGA
ncbi:MAG TPA: histidine--tRNA ligase [Candidatus Omnitrophota bacterium]|nr:histidine--tRNA ligase [Candidatus Omnitrophota bacterium]